MDKTIKQYRDWRLSRRAAARPVGFEVDVRDLNPKLREDQKAVVQWALNQGRSALFINTGGGKTFTGLEVSRIIAERTNKKVLVFGPLAVSDQIVREANSKWGIPAKYVRTQEEALAARGDIVVSNFELLTHFDTSAFGAVWIDESSIIKNAAGKTRHLVNKMLATVPYRLMSTATPSPNEHDELGNHSQALGIMPWHEMITRWFIRDSSQADVLRLKHHAHKDFWKWVASWAVCINKPSDIGFSDEGFNLPPLTIEYLTAQIDHSHAQAESTRSGQFKLFATEALSATELWNNKRVTLQPRMELAAEFVARKPNEACVIWVETNDEADALRAMLPDAVEVRGNESLEVKRAKLRAFSEGNEQLLITKLDIAGFGMNWQHCHRTAFASLTFSFERWYQGLKRFHRYGQGQPVEAAVISASTESNVMAALKRKEAQFMEMQEQMNAAMRATGLLAKVNTFEDYGYKPTKTMRIAPFIRPHAFTEINTCLA